MNNNEQNFSNFQNPINNPQPQTNDIQNQVMEPVPPVLTPIAPLTAADNNQAPTLDALGPMNLMPDELQSNNEVPNNFTQVVQPNAFAPEQPVQPQVPPVQQPVVQPQVPTSADYNNIINPQPVVQDVTPAPSPTPIAPEPAPVAPPVVEDYEINQNVSLTPPVSEPTPVAPLQENIEIQDTSLNEPTNEIQDMGLDPNYTKPSELEIMDIDSDDGKSLESSTPTDVDEIKSLIDKLKEKGSKIEVEEFDFDKIYQIIVKIEK